MKYKILAITPPTRIDGQEFLMPFHIQKIFDKDTDAKNVADQLLNSKTICAYRISYSYNETKWYMSDMVVYTPKEYLHIPLFANE